MRTGNSRRLAHLGPSIAGRTSPSATGPEDAAGMEPLVLRGPFGSRGPAWPAGRPPGGGRGASRRPRRPPGSRRRRSSPPRARSPRPARSYRDTATCGSAPAPPAVALPSVHMISTCRSRQQAAPRGVVRRPAGRRRAGILRASTGSAWAGCAAPGAAAIRRTIRCGLHDPEPARRPAAAADRRVAGGGAATRGIRTAAHRPSPPSSRRYRQGTWRIGVDVEVAFIPTRARRR